MLTIMLFQDGSDGAGPCSHLLVRKPDQVLLDEKRNVMEYLCGRLVFIVEPSVFTRLRRLGDVGKVRIVLEPGMEQRDDPTG